MQAVRESVPERSVVYSDQETSFRIAAFAPVYIAVAPPGHVADTMVNRPFERAREAREFLRTGDLAIPRRYEAEYLVVDRARGGRDFELPGALSRRPLRVSSLAIRTVPPPPASRFAHVSGLELDRRERGSS